MISLHELVRFRSCFIHRLDMGHYRVKLHLSPGARKNVFLVEFWCISMLTGAFVTVSLFMSRFVERNRRDVEEKSDQLKAISNLAALFCGFAVVTLTQFIVQQNYSPVSISYLFIIEVL